MSAELITAHAGMVDLRNTLESNLRSAYRIPAGTPLRAELAAMVGGQYDPVAQHVLMDEHFQFDPMEVLHDIRESQREGLTVPRPGNIGVLHVDESTGRPRSMTAPSLLAHPSIALTSVSYFNNELADRELEGEVGNMTSGKFIVRSIWEVAQIYPDVPPPSTRYDAALWEYSPYEPSQADEALRARLQASPHARFIPSEVNDEIRKERVESIVRLLKPAGRLVITGHPHNLPYIFAAEQTLDRNQYDVEILKTGIADASDPVNGIPYTENFDRIACVVTNKTPGQGIGLGWVSTRQAVTR